MNLKLKVLLLLTINVLTGLFIAGAILRPSSNSLTQAQTSPCTGADYCADWEMIECRVMSRSGVTPFSLGAAKWKVTYTISGHNVNEIWEATAWDDVSEDSSVSYLSTSGASCDKKESGPSNKYKRSGSYGWINSGSASGNNISMGSSTPKAWKVLGNNI